MADSLMKNSVTGTFFRTMKFVPKHLLFGTTFCYQFWAFYSAFTKNNFQNAFSHLIFLILHIAHLIEKLYQISQVFSSYFFFFAIFPLNSGNIYIYIYMIRVASEKRTCTVRLDRTICLLKVKYTFNLRPLSRNFALQIFIRWHISVCSKVMSHFLTKSIFFCFGANNKVVLTKLEEDLQTEINSKYLKKEQNCWDTCIVNLFNC